MEKIELLRKLRTDLASKKGRDYSYLVVFFLIFSFFIFFVIRPSIVMIVSLKREEQKLIKTKEEYEKVINDIVNIQTDLQLAQDKLHLLSEALPEKPYVNKVIKDIEDGGKKNSLTIRRIGIESISLKNKPSPTLNTITINLDSISGYDSLHSFMKDLTNQRRLKLIEKIDLKKDSGNATDSANLNAIILLKGFYL